MTEAHKNPRFSPNSENMRKLAVVMFIDIVGYSRMMSHDEEETLKILHDFTEIIDPLVNKYDGSILKRIGDGLFCEFSTALKSVQCGIEIHSELENYNRNAENKFPVKVRIGIHMGDVVQQDHDLLGDGVNIAARIEKIAQPGGICVSESIYSALGGHSQYWVVSMGQQPLKNIKQIPHLYQIVTGHEIKVTDREKPSKAEKEIGSSSKHIFSKRNLSLIIPTLIIIAVVVFLVTQNVHLTTSPPAKQEINQFQLSPHQQQFIDKVIEFKSSATLTSQDLVDYINRESTAKKLRFFKKREEIENLDGKFVIIAGDPDIYTVVLARDSCYYDLLDNNNKKSLLREFYPDKKNRYQIWIELY